VRSRGSLIRSTNGHSNGIVPWLKTLDSSVAAVNQGGKRKGAACVYLETWHADIEDFLELRDNTGDDRGAPTTSTWPTGCRTCSCSASKPTRTGRCSIRAWCPS
jgi:ribonucleotide reductase alpha subunit